MRNNRVLTKEQQRRSILMQLRGVPAEPKQGYTMGRILQIPQNQEYRPTIPVVPVTLTAANVDCQGTVVVIIVYNRFENLKHWVECWNKCNKNNSELVVIHNLDSDNDSRYVELAKKYEIKYVARPNFGFDMGALQDVCNERLPGFPNNWKNLIWLTDDLLPMRKDFVSQFVRILNRGQIPCLEISDERRTHIRTTGLCVTKEISKKIKFPDPLVSKDDCYKFEHGDNSFYSQLVAMGLKTEMISPVHKAPLWDTEHRSYLNRMNEHKHTFEDKVVFICPIFNSFPEIISSIMNQTHENWELQLIHDGPPDNDLVPRLIKAINDPRIKYKQTQERSGNWGHILRRNALIELQNREDVGYVVITNADNFHVPVYCELMLKGFENNSAVAVFCSVMVHNYKNYEPQSCKMERGHVDCAGVMLKKDVACEICWRDIETHSSDWVFFEDIIKKYGVNRFVRVDGCLLIHC